MTIVLLLLVALLAFSNGANDNSKGVATLVGYGAAKPFEALIYAAITTALGGCVAFFLAGGLLTAFKGGWLFDKSVEGQLNGRFYLAVLIGACCWILIATRTGMPVSTTHAIIGALCGAGLISFGSATFQWAALGRRFAVPLALSPVLSLAVVYVVAWPVLFIVSRMAGKCACVVEEPVLAGAGAVAGTMSVARQFSVVVGEESKCPPEDRAAAVTTTGAANGLHWLSAGMISFARGWNDTPKIAAFSVFALAGVAHGTLYGFIVVLTAMTVGGIFAARKVLDTLSRKLTPLPLAESLTASMVSAALVSLASWMALPVSTTHVTTGTIIGAGLKKDPRGVKWNKVTEIVLSWIITLPAAAMIAALVKMVIR